MQSHSLPDCRISVVEAEALAVVMEGDSHHERCLTWTTPGSGRTRLEKGIQHGHVAVTLVHVWCAGWLVNEQSARLWKRMLMRVNPIARGKADRCRYRERRLNSAYAHQSGSEHRQLVSPRLASGSNLATSGDQDAQESLDPCQRRPCCRC